MRPVISRRHDQIYHLLHLVARCLFLACRSGSGSVRSIRQSGRILLFYKQPIYRLMGGTNGLENGKFGSACWEALHMLWHQELDAAKNRPIGIGMRHPRGFSAAMMAYRITKKFRSYLLWSRAGFCMKNAIYLTAIRSCTPALLVVHMGRTAGYNTGRTITASARRAGDGHHAWICRNKASWLELDV